MKNSNMRKAFAVFLVLLVPFCVLAAQEALWENVAPDSITAPPAQSSPRFYRTVKLNQTALTALLARVPMEFTAAAKTKKVLLSLPKPDGTMATFRIEESPMVSAEVARERPDWKTYSGRGVDDPTAVLRLSWSNEGLRAYVVGIDGSYYIDPYAKDNREQYLVYFKNDASTEAAGSFHCGIDQYLANEGTRAKPTQLSPNAPEFSNGVTLRTYRVAIATTGEYTVDRGGQAAALTDVMNAVNRINLIYRRDLSVRLTLVSGTNTVFPNPATDPYNNTDEETQLTINQTQLDTIIGSANYDLGHLFGTGGGGIASSPSVCSTQKAEGYSARVPPTGDPFWVDYVAHEMGHQLSAQHTYNTLDGSVCSTRSDTDAYEVGSGSTIMSYVGICEERNLQQFSTDVFHVRSLTQIIDEVNNGQGSDCGTTSATNNSVPVVNPGPNRTIPRLTPFTLTATATDANAGDALTYTWEEYDLSPSASGPNGTPAGTYDVDTDGVLRPLFRSYPPSTSGSRTFPSLPYILNNANTPPLTFTGTSPTGAVCETGITCVTGENLPSVTRTMNFRVVVRDNQTGVNDAGIQVNVRADSGPFVVTSPNTGITATGGAALNVTWNVANTTAAPVSAANVKISLSTNGGATFPTVLIASTPNDGSQAVTIPNVATTTARIKVEAVGNIFFDVSNANFTIQGGAGGGTTSTAGRGDFDGDGSLDYVLYNSTTRRTAIWYLNGNALADSAYGPTLPAGWALACVADVNLDSRPDYILYNSATRRTAIWYLDNNVFTSSVYGPTLPVGWTLNATADINQDTRADYVLNNTATRQTAFWYLNGVSIIGTAYGPTLPAGWRLSDALDFNTDNKADYLLVNPTTRRTALWYLNGAAFAGSAYGPTFPAGWDVEGAGDFNASGQPDYVLFEAATRRTAFWYLNGVTFSSSAYGPTIAPGYILASP